MQENNPNSNQARPSAQGETPQTQETFVMEKAPKKDYTWLIVAVVAIGLAICFPYQARTVGIFVLTLSVLVFVHEWGHFQFGRWAGMKINRFGIGFPPWIYTRRRNGIDYSVGALPIGGMVDIAGLGSEEEMVGTVKGDSTLPLVRRSNIRHGQLMFQEASLGWRFLTLFAGPLMNFIYAIVIFVGVYSFVGVVDKVTETTQIEMVQAGQPADLAGLQRDDTIVAINGKRADSQLGLSRLIRSVKEPQMTITVLRDGKEINKVVNPIFDEGIKTLDGKGVERVATIGILFRTTIDSYKKVGFGEAISTGVYNATGFAREIVSMLGRAVTGRLDSREVRGISGPVGILQATQVQADRSLPELILFTGALSLNLGLLNLLPLPALDGGRIMFLAYEFVARRPFDPAKETMVNVVGMVMLLTFMAAITLRDVWPYIAKGFNAIT